MNETEFYKRLTESVDYGKYEHKAELMKILKSCYVTFNKTRAFTKKSWQFWEDVEIRVPIPFMEEIQEHNKYLSKLCFDIYEETDDYDLSEVLYKVGKRAEELDEIIVKEVYFEEIQKQIINEIRSAKYTIWVAVAWFTDPILFDELKKKKNEGVNIQLIINDDNINRNYGFEYESYFETYRIPQTGYFKNIMHHKFCVVDLKTAIHGSYNWSKKAQFNKETISIDEDRSLAEQFADEFIKLKASML